MSVSGQLFRYFDDRAWAEAFVSGSMRFRSLAYYRDLEEEEAARFVRSDPNEGRSLYQPEGGLVIHNHTQKKTIVVPSRLVSTVKAGEIFVYCLSRRRNATLWQEFKAKACVEINNIPAFCSRVMSGLPAGYRLGGKPSRERLGRRVTYYEASEPPGTRWALPDEIASSKLADFSWQEEFRLTFTTTDALAFQNLQITVAPIESTSRSQPHEHHYTDIVAPSLADICRIHDHP